MAKLVTMPKLEPASRPVKPLASQRLRIVRPDTQSARCPVCLAPLRVVLHRGVLSWRCSCKRVRS